MNDPYINLLVLQRDDILQILKDKPKTRSLAIQAQRSWFDWELSEDPKLAGYPFNLGIWATQLAKDIQRQTGENLLRLNLVFAYVVGDNYYRGIVMFDLPLKQEISVRVTEQRHLKIKPDSVTLASIHDDTEFATWRPELSLNDPTKLIWMQQKVLQTTMYHPADEYCPVFSDDVCEAVRLLCVRKYNEYAEMQSYCSPARLSESLSEIHRCRARWTVPHPTDPNCRIVVQNGLTTPPIVFEHYAHIVAHFKTMTRCEDFDLGEGFEKFHAPVLERAKAIQAALTAQYEQAAKEGKVCNG